jgi:ATP phosphoribosyltransferase
LIKLALPTGDLRNDAASLLTSLGLHSGEYADGSRALRFGLASEDAELRVFREKDIPIQVALGNYDLGLCNRIWLDELHARFPQDQVAALCEFGFGSMDVVAAASPETLRDLGPVERWGGISGIRIVSEFPNLAEQFALRARLPRFHVMPVWGAASSYPPEDGELAIFADAGGVAERAGLSVVARLSTGSECLLANRTSLGQRDLSAVLGPLLRVGLPRDWSRRLSLPSPRDVHGRKRQLSSRRDGSVRLALPDGHAQRHTYAALAAAGIEFEGYGEKTSIPRPETGIAGLTAKVIRPQDMPLQVANGSFDLAITGRDWLFDHQIAFPSSPVCEVADLSRSRYNLCAVVDEALPCEHLAEAVTHWRASGRNVIRIASEYANLADHYARQRHLGRYKIVPVSGASEGFVPEDAEILIEGTETGASVAANRLKIIERFFESTNCVIARDIPLAGPAAELSQSFVARLRNAVAVSA